MMAWITVVANLEPNPNEQLEPNKQQTLPPKILLLKPHKSPNIRKVWEVHRAFWLAMKLYAKHYDKLATNSKQQQIRQALLINKLIVTV